MCQIGKQHEDGGNRGKSHDERRSSGGLGEQLEAVEIKILQRTWISRNADESADRAFGSFAGYPDLVLDRGECHGTIILVRSST